MNTPNDIVSTTPPSPPPDAKQKLPFKQIVTRPSYGLRLRILELTHKTGKSAKKVLEMLLGQAAGMVIEWIIVEQRNGSEAGVSLQKVEDALMRTFFALRNVKGAIKTLGTTDQMAKVDTMMTESITLWSHAQSLAKDTFYNCAELVAGRKVYRMFSKWIVSSQKTIDAEVAKGDLGNQTLIAENKSRIVDYTLVLKVLERLGFSPAGPHRDEV